MSIMAPTLGMEWEIIRSCGYDPLPIFNKLAIDPALIKNPNARIPYTKRLALYRESVQLTKNPGMWLSIEDHWHPSHLGALGYAWLASSTLRTALMRAQRYIRTISTNLELHYQEDAQSFHIEFVFKEQTGNQYGRDGGAIMLLLTMCRANYGKELDPVDVILQQPEPSSAGEYFKRFKCPVTFDQPQSGLTFDIEAIDKPLNSSNPELARLSDQVMISYLAKLDKQDIRHQVMSEILLQLPSGNTTDASVAAALYLNPRTLQRRLCEDGTSFKALLNEARVDLAREYIKNNHLTLTEVSFMLGFSEVSSFSRAFKRWTGKSPSAVRSSD